MVQENSSLVSWSKLSRNVIRSCCPFLSTKQLLFFTRSFSLFTLLSPSEWTKQDVFDPDITSPRCWQMISHAQSTHTHPHCEEAAAVWALVPCSEKLQVWSNQYTSSFSCRSNVSRDHEEFLSFFLMELLALQMFVYLLKAFQLSVGFNISSLLWSSVIIWLNEEPPRVCGSCNDTVLSAGWCTGGFGRPVGLQQDTPLHHGWWNRDSDAQLSWALVHLAHYFPAYEQDRYWKRAHLLFYFLCRFL